MSGKPKPRLRKIVLRTILAALAIVVLWFGIRILTWPNVAALAQTNPKSTAFIDRYRKEAAHDKTKPKLRWKWVSDRAISSNLKRAVVVSEDVEFFSHNGFSEKEIRAAIEKAIDQREFPRGASTITQQLAKNLWLSPSRNPLRKIEEAILARQLEKNLSKRRILEIYLNVVEMGPGIYGAEAAAQAYFGKSAASLSAREASSLAASLPRPSKWHPGSGSRSYSRRVARVERMTERASFLGRLVGGRTDEEVLASLPKPAPLPEPNAQPIERMPSSATTQTPGTAPAPVESNLQPPLVKLPPPSAAQADSIDRMQKLLEELKRDMEQLQEEEKKDAAADDGGAAPQTP
ncbi:MAG TPA: monofunctional biosynthetic peptidoglycan transglycosylase [bacterium]|nr:monofunctional biosynthetic peptidoglycan transglycosylase [bacterium]